IFNYGLMRGMVFLSICTHRISVMLPTSVPPDSPESFNGVAERLTKEISGAYRPDQFANPNNPLAHY
ncbi:MULTISPECIES: hypothetical protein, partial [unclassified Microcoleus]|uniref:hypothetical protein n=1 Tax=unclassified Microcoleus TaxID=2642155 RepID=UPI002FD114D0